MSNLLRHITRVQEIENKSFKMQFTTLGFFLRLNISPYRFIPVGLVFLFKNFWVVNFVFPLWTVNCIFSKNNFPCCFLFICFDGVLLSLCVHACQSCSFSWDEKQQIQITSFLMVLIFWCYGLVLNIDWLKTWFRSYGLIFFFNLNQYYNIMAYR